MRIGITEVFVDDQDKALRFYTDVLGMQLKTDAPYDGTRRWLTVVSPEQPDGPELLLALLTDAGRGLQSARLASGSPAISFTTADCRESSEQLRRRGVTFRRPPEALGYGGIDAVFEDGCGNLVNLHQGSG
jgi:catechol 2,3-dioxygenase-like lactoylglutathione lyase family enzyme